MNPILFAALVGLIVGAGGTGGGALITFAIKTSKQKLSAALMGLSGGIMLATVAFDLLPHAFEHTEVLWAVTGTVAGVLAMLVVTKLIPHIDSSEYNEEVIGDLRSKRLTRAGVLLAVGIAIHNLPQGVALGGGVLTGMEVALPLLLLFHNIPEGMAMAIPLKVGGVPKGKILLIALAAALPTVVGAVIGASVSTVSETFIGMCMGFAAGAMLYLTLKELIPQAIGMEKSAFTVLFIAVGVVLGGVVVWIFHH